MMLAAKQSILNKETKLTFTEEIYFIINKIENYESLRKIFAQISSRPDEEGYFSAIAFDLEDPKFLFHAHHHIRFELHKLVEGFIEDVGILVSCHVS